jgi:hypothetical protein
MWRRVYPMSTWVGDLVCANMCGCRAFRSDVEVLRKEKHRQYMACKRLFENPKNEGAFTAAMLEAYEVVNPKP